MKQRWTKVIILLGFCGGFILFGLLAAGSTVVDLRDAWASQDWPATEGEVTYSTKRRSRKNLKSLEYGYTVNQTAYLATRAAFIRVPYTKPVYRIYHKGQRVDVRYDPADPSRAVLEPGAPVLGIIAEMAVPALLIMFGSAGLFFGFRR